MRKSFANQPSPLVVNVVRERTVRDAIAKIRNGEYAGAKGIDLHLSCLNDEYKNTESIKMIVDSTHLPILSLNYNQTYECEGFETDEETRVDLLLKSAEAGVSAVDVQSYTYDLYSKTNFREEFSHLDYSFIKGNPNEIVVDQKIIDKQMELFEKIHHHGSEVLLSCHPMIPMNTEQVVELALFLEKRKPDIIKIIAYANNEEDLVEAFKTMITLKKEVKTVTHFHCAGRAGKLSRIINPVLGGHLAFCNDGFTASSNFEQLDLKTALSVIENLKRIMGE